MARAGDVIGNAYMPEEIRFIKTAADTNGQLLEMEATYKPKGEWNLKLEHYHPKQDEHFDVLAGMISIRVNGREQTYVAGESFDVPRGTVHIMANRSHEPATVRWQVRPALNAEDFYVATWGFAEQGKLTDLLQYAVLARAYKRVFVLAKPGYAMQVLMFGPLAFIGRLLGRRAMPATPKTSASRKPARA